MAVPLRKLRRKRESVEIIEPVPEEPRRRRRRLRPGRRMVASALTAVVVAGVAAVALVAGGSEEPEARRTSLEFATVRRTELVSVRSFDGEVASREGPAILGRGNGTITSLAAEATLVERGHTLYEVDGRPVVLLYGAVPAWRDIGGTVTGDDVRQLEENLEALGFETGVVDETFTTTTASAVKSWQESLGITDDGVVRLGLVVFAPAALTVSEHVQSIGSPARDGEEVLSTVSDERVATVTLDDADDLASGNEVTIVLPDNTRVPAKVSSVETPTGTGAQDDGSSTTATVVPDDANALGDVEDGSGIDVEFVEDARESVLVVPVTALVARQGGGYAVELQRGTGTQLVTVEPGLYADDLVEITGDVEQGDRVVVP